MDVDSTVGSGANALHAELQSRYTKLEQEYRDIYAQHEAQVQNSSAQRVKVDLLETEKAYFKDHLEHCRSEYQRLEHNFKQEQERIKQLENENADLQRHLRDAFDNSKQEHDRIKRLETKNADLQTALETQALEEQSRKVEPLPIESTTVQEMTDSDNDDPELDDSGAVVLGNPPLSVYTLRPSDWVGYEMFVLSDAITGTQGYRWIISQSLEEAKPQITGAFRQAEVLFGNQFELVTILGQSVLHNDPELILEILKTNKTILVAHTSRIPQLKEDLSNLARTTSSSSSYQPTITVPQAASVARGQTSLIRTKRRLSTDYAMKVPKTSLTDRPSKPPQSSPTDSPERLLLEWERPPSEDVML